MASNTNYSDPKFGLVRRVVGTTEDDVGATGQSADAFSVYERTSIVKFGIVPASDIVCTTTTTFVLETESGTDLATFIPGSAVLATGEATGIVPETATTIAANQVVRGNVTVVGDSGKFLWYVDLREQFDAS